MKVLVVFGTRPEAIKLAPVIRALAAAEWCEPRICVTAQHRDLLDPLLDLFGIAPDHDLDVMRPNQALAGLTARLCGALDDVMAVEQPAWVVVQGDTTSAFAAGLVAFYHRARVGHVEAGLRTTTKDAPFPEELNRRLLGRIADLHFAPTERARQQLLAEGVAPEAVLVTGNTAIDALQWTIDRLGGRGPTPETGTRRLVLVTMHRRESFGRPLADVCGALRWLADRYRDRVEFLFPVHPNPNVLGEVTRALSGCSNVRLVKPLPYPDLVDALRRAHFVLTDSGGIQEEAPSLGKPVLVLRDATERPEGVAAGVAAIVGTDRDRIVDASVRLLDDDDAYRAMARAVTVYGDGHAAERIVSALERAATSEAHRREP
ncbi:MAG: UDP-N-acetylglucosamine 2-epimerase (non-hydrolyzing) [Acidobacteria bacterium]|nr:UDP-N-acetylglucosamine 2-epimerase (non-hydrolyzing) [Acidobacteriota bacterium]